MMFIVRGTAAPPAAAPVAIKAMRKTPAIIPLGTGKTDFFCVGEPESMAALREQGWEVVELRDGWYADDAGGGIGISGHGRYWEVRDTPFSVTDSAKPEGGSTRDPAAGDDQVEVRRAIFGV